ncbi:hypothetical protein G9C98_006082 [Cotesia typhae]|uniref:RNA 3'-terminal phosphate cyclase-like protein n=1 Tax=Cotesia typhae TaxID=2053667 RepID=A0A8J5QSU4_9HYME|nr:hypothetical protein G9C98_006082 [Cotesia typhae]
MSQPIEYKGCNYLKQRLLLSTLSGKSVKITDIRANKDDPGVRAFEVNLVGLLEKLSNGMKVKFNETGTNLRYDPGMLIGGNFVHECNIERGIGYYLEAVMILAPFCKNPINIKLKGITETSLDPSIDRIKAAGLPVLKKFFTGDSDNIKITIVKRGIAPNGGGEVHFKCPVVRFLKPVYFIEIGSLKRIRGIACSMRVSGDRAVMVAKSAKEKLWEHIQKRDTDINIIADPCRKEKSGNSPGFAITINAETTTGVILTAQACSSKEKNDPEDIGKEAALKLLDELYRNGCVDSVFQSMAIIFMALNRRDVSKMIVGPLTQSAIQTLRDLKDFFSVVLKLDYHKDEDGNNLEQVVLLCMGIEYCNLSKRLL